MLDQDHPYKDLFTHPELVADLLRLTGLAEDFDFATLDRRNGSYVAEDWRERESDVIWRLRWSGRDLYVYLLIEFQSEVDPDMAVRVMTYVGLLWQDLRRSKALPAGDPLPPVLPLVLYNGESPWCAPRDLQAAMGPVPPLIAPYQPQMAFLLLDEVRMVLRDDCERNLAAAVFRLERTGSPLEHHAIGKMVVTWLRGSGRDRVLAAFQRWWVRTLTHKHSLPATINPFAEDPMLTTRIEQWKATVEATSQAKGRAEGKAEGKAEGIIELVRDGLLTGAVAELRLRHLHDQCVIDDALLAVCLERLKAN